MVLFQFILSVSLPEVELFVTDSAMFHGYGLRPVTKVPERFSETRRGHPVGRADGDQAPPPEQVALYWTWTSAPQLPEPSRGLNSVKNTEGTVLQFDTLALYRFPFEISETLIQYRDGASDR